MKSIKIVNQHHLIYVRNKLNKHFITFFKVFVQLEHPALKLNEETLRLNISLQRKTFIDDVMDAQKNKMLDAEFFSVLLQHYEMIAQAAVEGNLQLTNTDKNLTEAFPVQSEKWTILQAIFFASTICTTIGEDCMTS